jgi:beta-glucosidase
MLEGIRSRAARDHIEVSYDDGTNPSSAKSAARSADLAIVVAADTESEGVDKPCMSLVPQCSGGQSTSGDLQATQAAFGDHDRLIREIASANPHTVVVPETGAPVLTPWRNQIAGLLEAWYPGEDGGTAVAHVLFGDADPGGRLRPPSPRTPATSQALAGRRSRTLAGETPRAFTAPARSRQAHLPGRCGGSGWPER